MELIRFHFQYLHFVVIYFEICIFTCLLMFPMLYFNLSNSCSFEKEMRKSNLTGLPPGGLNTMSRSFMLFPFSIPLSIIVELGYPFKNSPRRKKISQIHSFPFIALKTSKIMWIREWSWQLKWCMFGVSAQNFSALTGGTVTVSSGVNVLDKMMGLFPNALANSRIGTTSLSSRIKYCVSFPYPKKKIITGLFRSYSHFLITATKSLKDPSLTKVVGLLWYNATRSRTSQSR